MTEYDNTNRGSIWKNDNKETERHPDFKGSINVEGVEYWVSAWKRKEGANPKAPALSFSIKKKEQDSHNQQKSNGYAPDNSVNQNDGDFDDDIPF